MRWADEIWLSQDCRPVLAVDENTRAILISKRALIRRVGKDVLGPTHHAVDRVVYDRDREGWTATLYRWAIGTFGTDWSE